MSTFDFLRQVPLFAEMSDDDLGELCQNSQAVELDKGAMLFAEGDMGDQAYIIRHGELEIVKNSTGREVLLAVRQRGEVIGELALLEQAPRMASVRAKMPASLISIQKETLDHLLATSPSAARAMLQTVMQRWKATQAQLRQSEKMAQLGTMTAGVAHELNNPAAAVKRGAEQLRLVLVPYAQAEAALSRFDLDARQQQVRTELAQRFLAGVNIPPELDPLARSDREYELEEWLENAGISDAWQLAPSLIDLHLTPALLTEWQAVFPPAPMAALLHWLVAGCQAFSVLHEISQGAGRISEIIKALKAYSYLDQAPVQNVDIHEGLDSTLVILRAKLKQGITVHKEYAPHLPRIQAYASELNQVWTNLLDNAADALEGHGDITLRTRREDDWVIVEIQDNGPGIPEDIQPRIFNAFFTTKPPGKGTGLGLNISYNIVVFKHRGDILVYSRPGFTCFQVWLPINFDNAGTKPDQTAFKPETS